MPIFECAEHEVDYCCIISVLRAPVINPETRRLYALVTPQERRMDVTAVWSRTTPSSRVGGLAPPEVLTVAPAQLGAVPVCGAFAVEYVCQRGPKGRVCRCCADALGTAP
jgi:hypothetical protein